MSIICNFSFMLTLKVKERPLSPQDWENLRQTRIAAEANELQSLLSNIDGKTNTVFALCCLFLVFCLPLVF